MFAMHICNRLQGKSLVVFNSVLLLSQAWGVAVSPANVTAGFRTCGVYQFNHSAISVTVPPSTLSDVMPHEDESGSA